MRFIAYGIILNPNTCTIKNSEVGQRFSNGPLQISINDRDVKATDRNWHKKIGSVLNCNLIFSDLSVILSLH